MTTEHIEDREHQLHRSPAIGSLPSFPSATPAESESFDF